jgi:tetratricopeptide (TPR) repeat protein
MLTRGRLFITTLRVPAIMFAVALALVIACGGQASLAQPVEAANICTGRLQQGLDDMIRACSWLIDQHNSSSDQLSILYTSRGAALRQKGDLDRALADHNEAIRLQPGSALLYFNRAITWQTKNDVARAEADFGETIRRAPAFVLAYRSRGDLLYGKGDYSAAIRDYDAAIRLAASDAHALTMRGLAKWQLGDGDGGKADIAAAMRLDAGTAVALVGRAQPAAIAATTPPGDRPTIWNFKGSQIALKAEGAERRFYYDTPRPELVVSGITSGTLLFEGRQDGNQLVGKAFVFSRKCGARSYDVSGPVDERASAATITLSGKRIQIGTDCLPTGGFQNDVLVFSRPAR